MLKHSRYFANPFCLDGDDVNSDSEIHLRNVKEQLIPNIVKNIIESETPETTDPDGELYVGAAGIAYAFYHAYQTHPSYYQQYLQLAQRYLQPAMYQLEQKLGNNKLSPGLLCGDAGVIAIAAIISLAIGDDEKCNAFINYYVKLGEICRPVTLYRSGSDEFFIGRAGYIYGALWLNYKLGKIVVPLDIIHELAKITIISGKNYAAKNSSPCPLMYAYYETEYLGAAHGLSSILQTLIQIPDFLDMNTEADYLVHTCVDYILSLETPSANYPCALDEIGHNARSEERELVHWCHGAPGIIYLMGAAYLRWRDQRYIEACKRIGNLVWHKGLLKKGPGICHGVAGNGYVFLLLYRLTGDIIYYHRAVKFAGFLTNENFKCNARTPDKPYSLYEGLAGTLCFLTDLGCPEKATFPFQDIFLK